MAVPKTKNNPKMIRDGSVYVFRGNEQFVDNEIESSFPTDFEDWSRVVRGGIITGGFHIDMNLSICIMSYLIGFEDEKTDQLKILKNEILDRLPFDRKLAVFLETLKKSRRDTKKIRKDLDDFRAIRNSLAHNPVWFEAHFSDGEDPSCQEICTFILVGKKVRHVTNDVVKTWNALVQRLIKATNPSQFLT